MGLLYGWQSISSWNRQAKRSFSPDIPVGLRGPSLGVYPRPDLSDLRRLQPIFRVLALGIIRQVV